MSIGQAVRRAMGPYEQRVADRYRAFFLDVDDLAAALASFEPAPRILEIGCGDGHVSTALLQRLPTAHVTAIDIVPEPGRLFAGDPQRVTFRSCTAEALLAEGGAPFDLVVLSDVLHHVPDDLLSNVVECAGRLCAPGGVLAVKEWERNRGVGYFLGWFSDRVISGQRIRFFDRDHLQSTVEQLVPGTTLIGTALVKPRRSNLLLVWRTAPADIVTSTEGALA